MAGAAGVEQEAAMEGKQEEAVTEGVQQDAVSGYAKEEVAMGGDKQETAMEGVQQDAVAEGAKEEAALDGVEQETAMEGVQQDAVSEGAKEEAAMDGFKQETAMEGVQQDAVSEGAKEEAAMDGVNQETAIEGLQQDDVSDDVKEEAAMDGFKQEAAMEVVQQDAVSQGANEETAMDGVKQDTVMESSQQNVVLVRALQEVATLLPEVRMEGAERTSFIASPSVVLAASLGDSAAGLVEPHPALESHEGDGISTRAEEISSRVALELRGGADDEKKVVEELEQESKFSAPPAMEKRGAEGKEGVNPLVHFSLKELEVSVNEKERVKEEQGSLPFLNAVEDKVKGRIPEENPLLENSEDLSDAKIEASTGGSMVQGKKKDEEDVCFICYDGGDLVVCDRRSCPKSYHLECLDSPPDLFVSGGNWHCDWHCCRTCKKAAIIQCQTCLWAYCQVHYNEEGGDWFRFDRRKALCDDCFPLVKILENCESFGPDGKKIDFDDPDTHENYFREYYITYHQKKLAPHIRKHKDLKLRTQMKQAERMTDAINMEEEVITEAGKKKRGRGRPKGSGRAGGRGASLASPNGKANKRLRLDHPSVKSKESSEDEKENEDRTRAEEEEAAESMEEEAKMEKDNDEEDESDSLEEEVAQQEEARLVLPDRDLDGWASTDLKAFLTGRGVDASERLPWPQLLKHIWEHIRENKLKDPQEKEKICCDQVLTDLFGVASVRRNQIPAILSRHYAKTPGSRRRRNRSRGVKAEADAEQLRQEEKGDGAGELDEENYRSQWKAGSGDNLKVSRAGKRVKRGSHGGRRQDVRPDANDFAKIDMTTIGYIYLNRPLLENLLDDPDFDGKVVNSFVRIRHNDVSYRLVRIVGVSSETETYKVGSKTSNKVLHILNSRSKAESVTIENVSSKHFTEAECTNLRKLMKWGVLQRLTVGEIEQKALELQKSKLHEWFEVERQRLVNLRDRASERGDKKDLRIHVEELKKLASQEYRNAKLGSPPKVEADPKMSTISVSEEEDEEADNPGAFEVDSRDSKQKTASWGRSEWGQRNSSVRRPGREREPSLYSSRQEEGKGQWTLTSVLAESEKDGWAVRQGGGGGGREGTAGGKGGWEERVSRTPLAASLGDGDSWGLVRRPAPPPSAGLVARVLNPLPINEDEEVWHYQDPSGTVQGPFSLAQLREWFEKDLIPSDLRIWKAGQERDVHGVEISKLISKAGRDSVDPLLAQPALELPLPPPPPLPTLIPQTGGWGSPRPQESERLGGSIYSTPASSSRGGWGDALEKDGWRKSGGGNDSWGNSGLADEWGKSGGGANDGWAKTGGGGSDGWGKKEGGHDGWGGSAGGDTGWASQGVKTDSLGTNGEGGWGVREDQGNKGWQGGHEREDQRRRSAGGTPNGKSSSDGSQGWSSDKKRRDSEGSSWRDSTEKGWARSDDDRRGLNQGREGDHRGGYSRGGRELFKSDRPCRYMAQKGYCKSGDKCAFKH